MGRPKNNSNILIIKELAERVGFEPTLPFRVNTLSKRAPSATRPSLRRKSGRKLLWNNWAELAVVPTWLVSILWALALQGKSLFLKLMRRLNLQMERHAIYAPNSTGFPCLARICASHKSALSDT